jgi:hypothetical protein
LAEESFIREKIRYRTATHPVPPSTRATPVGMAERRPTFIDVMR